MFILDLSQQEVHWQHRWIGFSFSGNRGFSFNHEFLISGISEDIFWGATGQVVSMNLILYGSLVMVAYSKPWRAMVCNFLDMTLGRLGTRYPRYSEIRRFTRTRENSQERGWEKWRSLFFFSGVVSGGFKSLAYCILYPFQQIGIFNDLQSLIFFRGLKTPTRDDVPGNMNTCCFLICRFSQTRIIQPAPGTSKRGFSYGSNCFDLTILTTFPSGSVTRRQSQKIVNGWPWLVIWIITPSSCE